MDKEDTTNSVKYENKDVWKDKFRFYVLTVECLISLLIYSIPYSLMSLEIDLERVI